MSNKAAQQQIPTYLNETCLRKALEKASKTNCIKIESWQWKLTNLSGGNFCSNIYRVHGNYKILPTALPALTAAKKAHEAHETAENTRQFNFIIKDMIMDIAEIGTNELCMFENILPEMMKILESLKVEKSLTTTNKLAANCFLTESNEEREFYVLEDLNALGYNLGNRFDGFNFEAAKLVLEKLAKFHAASMVYAEKCPDVISKLNSAHFAKGAEDEIAKSIVENGMTCAMETFKTIDKETAAKMKSLMQRFDEKIAEVVNPANSVFNVLNHGDFWLNNMLLKQEATVADALFVDFQNVFWGGPSFDVNYFLFTSLCLSTLQTQSFELLTHYFKTLKLVLESLGYTKIPTWSDFQKEMQRGALVGYYAALCELPICVMSEESAKGFTAETFLDGSEQWKAIYKTEKVRQFVRHAVSYFEQFGLFVD